MTEINRRTFLQGLAGGAITLTGTGSRAATARDVYVAARREGDGGFAAAVFDLVRGDIARVALPDRGHGAAVNRRTGECVVFARRPGTYAVVFHPRSGAEPLWLTSPTDRHFYGHGVFSGDGRLLFTTEQIISSGAGLIGVRNATDNYRLIGEFSSFGIGPHDIVLMPDGKTLAIANGGIRTHPDSGRTPLNIDTMQPSLVYLNSETGEQISRHVLPKEWHKLSIRHLAASPDGTIAFGCQHKGPEHENAPLIGIHRPDGEPKLLQMGPLSYKMQNYVTSIAIDAGGNHVMATSARGNIRLVMDLVKEEILDVGSHPDVSGAASSKSEKTFLLTDGHGFARLKGSSIRDAHQFKHVNWDNHVTHYNVR